MVGYRMENGSQHSASTSIFASVKPAPPDGLLSLTIDYKNDPSDRKLDIGVGAYRTEDGKPYVLNVVRKAEKMLMADKTANKEYLPISGHAEFCQLSRKLAFGDCKRANDGSIITIQSVSGSGAIRVLAEFVHEHCPSNVIYLTNPAWDNYTKIFPSSHLDVRYLRYFDNETKWLDIQGLIEDLKNAEIGSTVVLQTCAHNPTGVDPSREEWKQILKVFKERKLLPFFDSAYQGFATGDIEGDSYALRLFEQEGMELLFAQSFSKNMGLYGERAGCLSIVCRDPQEAEIVSSTVRSLIRAMYATPPRHGAEIAAIILKTPELYNEWQDELIVMSERIKKMRKELHDALVARGTPGDWSCIVRQNGMFAFSGLSPAQAKQLTKKWHVYLPSNGRFSMAGLSVATCSYLADAVDDVVRNVH